MAPLIKLWTHCLHMKIQNILALSKIDLDHRQWLWSSIQAHLAKVWCAERSECISLLTSTRAALVYRAYKNSSLKVSPIWQRRGYFYPLVLFGSDFFSWIFIKNFKLFWRWTLTSIGLIYSLPSSLNLQKNNPRWR